MVLKRELARRSWAIDAFVGAVFKRRGGDSLGMGRGFNSAPILTGFHCQKASNFCHDRTTIAPRSGHDRPSIVILELFRSSSARVESIPRHKACDRGSIAAITARSCRDRGSIVKFFHNISAPSDANHVSRPMSIR